MSKRKIYWLCQILGWGSMVVIEMINYTFYIIKEFQWIYLVFFLASALLGILLTHGLRLLLLRTNFFERRNTEIWLLAAVFTLVLSFLISLGNLLPYIVQEPMQIWSVFRFLDLSASVMNWMRYVGPWIIIYFLYKVLEQNNQIIQEKLKVQHLAKTAELELLKTQLNPHFLFNALNSIKALVRVDPERSGDAIVQLSELLRYTLNYGQKTVVPLDEELEEVDKYLKLEKLRFGERLAIKTDVDPDTLNKPVPPASVLTLAENAIKYGVASHSGPAWIHIRAKMTGDSLLIEVSNSGTYSPGPHTGGIGLKQLRRRLEEIFGRKADFFIDNMAEGVMATIKLQLL